ncbi:MAG: glycosyltransferase family 2 protein [Gemmatimonadetes bacterium]|nr:glycosyltransferase family 2 protein [Gemmatimonadota bacterium]
MTSILLALPWAGIIAFLLLIVKPVRQLTNITSLDLERAPSVGVIIPARNESENIEECLASLTKSRYPNFEIIVVDDRSEDGTAELARTVPPGNAKRLVVIDGEALPEGWLGKPWACQQGARATSAELLVFADADTTHGDRLLSRSITELQNEDADLLNVLGFQVMESFWERLVQPQIFLAVVFRHPDLERSARSSQWQDGVANGQFMLMPRTSYEAIGGHESVRDRVLEDLALAQTVKRHGRTFVIRMAMDDLTTRMYHSLGGLIAGWSRLIQMGSTQGQPLVSSFGVVAVATFCFWIVPPLMLLSALLGFGGETLLIWSALVCSLSVGIHAAFLHFLGAPAYYAVFYPLGSFVVLYIMIRSKVRASDVEWKGRRYTVSN